MQGSGHILADRDFAVDSNPLGAAGRAALDGDGRPAATEVAGNEFEQFFVRLAVDGRRLELSEPSTVVGLRQQTDSRARLDLDRDDRGLRCGEGLRSPGQSLAGRLAYQGRSTRVTLNGGSSSGSTA